MSIFNVFVDILHMQNPFWQGVMLCIFAICFSLIVGGLLVITEAAVSAALGPIVLRIRMWKGRRAWKKRRSDMKHVAQLVGAYQQAQKELLARRSR